MAFDETDRMRAAAAREWMRRVSSLESRARSMRDAIEQARALMLPKGMSLEGGSSAGAYADAIPDGIAKLDAMVADYEAHLSALVDEERRARRAIASLGWEQHREVLEARYLRGESCAQIAERTGYSLAAVKKHHRDALVLLYDRMPPELRRIPEAV